MIKRTFGLVVCLTVAAGLAGCASNTAPPPAAPPVAAAAPAPAAPPPAQPMPPGLNPAQQHVAKIQMALDANGAQLQVDGRMGPKTAAALKAYQGSHNLKATGKADSATLKALGV